MLKRYRRVALDIQSLHQALDSGWGLLILQNTSKAVSLNPEIDILHRGPVTPPCLTPL